MLRQLKPRRDPNIWHERPDLGCRWALCTPRETVFGYRRPKSTTRHLLRDPDQYRAVRDSLEACAADPHFQRWLSQFSSIMSVVRSWTTGPE